MRHPYDVTCGLSVVTGASDGIGKQYAIQLACIHRLNVLLISRSIDKLKKVAEEIGTEDIVLLRGLFVKLYRDLQYLRLFVYLRYNVTDGTRSCIMAFRSS